MDKKTSRLLIRDAVSYSLGALVVWILLVIVFTLLDFLGHTIDDRFPYEGMMDSIIILYPYLFLGVIACVAIAFIEHSEKLFKDPENE